MIGTGGHWRCAVSLAVVVGVALLLAGCGKSKDEGAGADAKAKSGKKGQVERAKGATAEADEPESKQDDAAEPVEMKKEFVNSVGMQMVLIPAGEFQMGSTSEHAFWKEKPIHTVTITKPFYMGATEVTQKQYEAVMGQNPCRTKGINLPVERVRWHDAVEFCKQLSAQEGTTYRLPTEAQWEYACRAGTTTEFCFGDAESALGDYAWYDGNQGDREIEELCHAVAQKKSNAWGLYDMHGNVFEWCQDWYSESYYENSPERDPRGPADGESRVWRGGTSESEASHCRSAFRDAAAPTAQLYCVGFRVLCLAPGRGSRMDPHAERTPDIDQVKADLIGQRMGNMLTSGWKFASLSEFEEVVIVSENKTANILEYNLGMTLKDVRTGTRHCAEAIVVYRKSDDKWNFVSVSQKSIEKAHERKKR